MLKLKLQYLATWHEGLTHWKRPWCWEKLKEGGEGDDREWDGSVTSPIQWTWVWASSRSWWWTGKPGVLQSMESQSQDMTGRLNWLTDPCSHCRYKLEEGGKTIVTNWIPQLGKNKWDISFLIWDFFQDKVSTVEHCVYFLKVGRKIMILLEFLSQGQGNIIPD